MVKMIECGKNKNNFVFFEKLSKLHLYLKGVFIKTKNLKILQKSSGNKDNIDKSFASSNNFD